MSRIIPFAGLALSWVALGEEFGLTTVAGAAVIVVGVAMAMYNRSLRIPRFQISQGHVVFVMPETTGLPTWSLHRLGDDR